MHTTQSKNTFKKSNIIPIKTHIVTDAETYPSPTGEYSLKQNVFDPSKSSPPNDFMLKLHLRLSKY